MNQNLIILILIIHRILYIVFNVSNAIYVSMMAINIIFIAYIDDYITKELKKL